MTDNRHLKVKAKRLDNGEWVIGEKITIGDKVGILLPNAEWQMRYNQDIDEYFYATSEKNIVEIDPATICRPTGKKGKNGKDIWEKDIGSWTVYPEGKPSYTQYCVIEQLTDTEYGYGRWIGRITNGEWKDIWCELIWKNFEVIGNTIDHPELVVVRMAK